jgi:hypothetical protein
MNVNVASRPRRMCDQLSEGFPATPGRPMDIAITVAPVFLTARRARTGNERW